MYVNRLWIYQDMALCSTTHYNSKHALRCKKGFRSNLFSSQILELVFFKLGVIQLHWHHPNCFYANHSTMHGQVENCTICFDISANHFLPHNLICKITLLVSPTFYVLQRKWLQNRNKPDTDSIPPLTWSDWQNGRTISTILWFEWQPTVTVSQSEKGVNCCTEQSRVHLNKDQ